MKCSKCGKKVTDIEGDPDVYGLEIKCSPKGQKFRAGMKRQFGKYWKEKDCIYRFCMECWLDSLFGKD